MEGAEGTEAVHWGLQAAHAIEELCVVLPPGWIVCMTSEGQLRMLPPDVYEADTEELPAP